MAIVAIAIYYDIKGAFCITLIINTFIWWAHKNEWPSSIAEGPKSDAISLLTNPFENDTFVLIMSLVFLYILTLNGLVSSLSDIGKLSREDGTTPRSRWVHY